METEKRLRELGIVLPKVPAPIGTYVPYVALGNLLFLCGRAPCSLMAPTRLGKWEER